MNNLETGAARRPEEPTDDGLQINRKIERSPLDWHRDDLLRLRRLGASLTDRQQYLSRFKISVTQDALTQWEAQHG